MTQNSPSSKYVKFATLAWLLLFFILEVFSFQANFVVNLVMDMLIPLSALGLLVYAIFISLKRRNLSAYSSVILVIFCISTHYFVTPRITHRIYFSLYQSTWENIIEEIQPVARSESFPSRDPKTGIRYHISDYGKRLVAFPNNDGILDNWAGFVYDPDSKLEEISEFGRLVFSIQIAKNWYYCGFS